MNEWPMILDFVLEGKSLLLSTHTLSNTHLSNPGGILRSSRGVLQKADDSGSRGSQQNPRYVHANWWCNVCEHFGKMCLFLFTEVFFLMIRKNISYSLWGRILPWREKDTFHQNVCQVPNLCFFKGSESQRRAFEQQAASHLYTLPGSFNTCGYTHEGLWRIWVANLCTTSLTWRGCGAARPWKSRKLVWVERERGNEGRAVERREWWRV